jgi:hypothetical protein
MFQKKTEGKHRPLGWPVINTLEGRLSFWSNVTRPKNARNLRLMSKSGFFVRAFSNSENESSAVTQRRSAGCSWRMTPKKPAGLKLQLHHAHRRRFREADDHLG